MGHLIQSVRRCSRTYVLILREDAGGVKGRMALKLWLPKSQVCLKNTVTEAEGGGGGPGESRFIGTNTRRGSRAGLDTNFFQPVRPDESGEKSRDGPPEAEAVRMYDGAATPFQRMVRSGALRPARQAVLEMVYNASALLRRTGRSTGRPRRS